MTDQYPKSKHLITVKIMEIRDGVVEFSIGPGHRGWLSEEALVERFGKYIRKRIDAFKNYQRTESEKIAQKALKEKVDG